MKTHYFILLLSFFLFACNKEKIGGSIGINPELAKELRSQPEQLEIDGQNYILSTYISRDYSPTIEPNEKGITGIIKLIEVDSLAIPNSFSLERVYILKGDEIFTTKYKSQ